MKKLISIGIIIQMVLLTIICNAQTGNTSYGSLSGTAGNYNSNFGYSAGKSNNSSSFDNSFFGVNAGVSNTSGSNNSALGAGALNSNITGGTNTAIGANCLVLNTSGSDNTSIGFYAMSGNSTASGNTAIGDSALAFNQTGTGNTVAGYATLATSFYSRYNSALGFQALHYTTTGIYNTGVGKQALYYNSSGSENTAIGWQALFSARYGNYNTAMGDGALYGGGGSNNTADGYQSLLYALGSTNTGFGSGANGPPFTNNLLTNTTSLGFGAVPTASNQVFIGNSAVTDVWTIGIWPPSDGRFKKEIKQNVAGLDFINMLRPVSYNYDIKKYDEFSTGISKLTKYPSGPRRTGFIAQEVEQAMIESNLEFGGLKTPQNERDHYALSYSDFVVPLVNAVKEFDTNLKKRKIQIDSLINTLANISHVQSQDGVSVNNKFVLFQTLPSKSTENVKIRIYLSDSSAKSVVVISDLLGVPKKSFQLSSQEGISSVNIPSGALPGGTYLYSLYVNQSLVDSKRLVITQE